MARIQIILFFDNQIIYLMFHFLAFSRCSAFCTSCCDAYLVLPKIASANLLPSFYLMAILGLSTYYSYTINVGVVLLLFSSFGFALNNIEPERSNRMRNGEK